MTGIDDLAGQTLDLAAGRAAEAVVRVTRRRQGLTRFATSFVHQNVGDEHTAVEVTVVVDGRVAGASSSVVDTPGLHRLVDQALAAAAVQPVDEGWPGAAPLEHLGDADRPSYDDETAAAGPADRVEVVRRFVAEAGGLEAAGYCETLAEEVVLVTTAGQHVRSAATRAVIDGIARDGGHDGVGSIESRSLRDLDGAACGRAAADSALASARDGGPADLAPGRYEVVLSPRCVAYMLDFLTVYGFNAKMVAEGQSFASLGEVQLDERLSFSDDALDGRTTGLRFDADGTPKRRVDFVVDGRVVGLAHDRRTARLVGGGAESTGHGIGSPAMGAIPTNTFLTGSSPQPVDDLIAGVERGLWVKDFWYTRVLNPKSLVVTGLTRNGVFLIEDGAVKGPVSNLRFTQSPVAAFGPGQVLGVGDDARLAPGGLHVSSHHTPSLRLAAWNFTGGAAG
ncbi:MAG TPA: metallopeptidase TldD-related protein [Acidimicrobiales bacterium]|nr:metallopeptidase TldD-related protein [Acidimicrobiales bacterium]